MSYNLKSIKEEFKAKGIYYTDSKLAEIMKSYVTGVEVRDVYDPTCGDGALLAVFPEDLPKYGQEINEHQLEVCRERLNNFTGVAGDTLQEPAFMDKRFSVIMANPPFSIKWEQKFFDPRFTAPKMPPKSKADYAFILHILYLLAEDGVAVTLNFPGILYRGQAEGAIRKSLILQNVIDRVVHIPSGHFVDTNIATAIVVFRKNRTTTDITFEDKELEKERVVPLSEVQEKDYNLSVGAYIVEEKIVEYPPAEEMSSAVEQHLINNITKQLELSEVIDGLEGTNRTPQFARQIVELASKYIKQL